MEKKIPWYLSVWFIIVLYAITWWLLCIPAIVINVIRLIKYDKKKVPAIILGLVCLFIAFTAFITITELRKESEFDELLEAGKYDEALEYVDSLSKSNIDTYYKYAEIYAAQKNYDSAVDILLDYAEQVDVLNLSEGYFSRLGEYSKQASVEKQDLVKELHNKYSLALEKKQQKETKPTASNNTSENVSNDDADNDTTEDMESYYDVESSDEQNDVINEKEQQPQEDETDDNGYEIGQFILDGRDLADSDAPKLTVYDDGSWLFSRDRYTLYTLSFSDGTLSQQSDGSYLAITDKWQYIITFEGNGKVNIKLGDALPNASFISKGTYKKACGTYNKFTDQELLDAINNSQ